MSKRRPPLKPGDYVEILSYWLERKDGEGVVECLDNKLWRVRPTSWEDTSPRWLRDTSAVNCERRRLVKVDKPVDPTEGWFT